MNLEEEKSLDPGTRNAWEALKAFYMEEIANVDVSWLQNEMELYMSNTKELYDLISTFEKILKITNIDETTNTYSEDSLDFKNYTTIKAFIYSNKVYLDSVKDYNSFLNLPINKMLRKYYKFSLADDFENNKPNEQNTKK